MNEITYLLERSTYYFSLFFSINYSGIAKAVRLGSINLLHDDANTRIIPVDEFIPHPDYTPRKRYNDIALIRLKYKVEFNDFIWPACINTDLNNTNWPFVTAIGFGVTSLGKLNECCCFFAFLRIVDAYYYVKD